MPAIELVDVSKTFPHSTGAALLRSHVAQSFQRMLHREKFYALKHVSFRVERGESLAAIGPNGAGKSTLLSLIAGLVPPDEGTIAVKGRVAALLELGCGFHPDLTGAENVLLNAALLGLSRKEIRRRFDEILEFSGIGEFINQPLRTYSSGMVVRLAFSVAVTIEPDILLIDEVLAVGDQSFQTKCIDKIYSLRRRGKTLICVSHASGMVQKLCDRAIWLDHGESIMQGSAVEVMESYSGRQTATT